MVERNRKEGKGRKEDRLGEGKRRRREGKKMRIGRGEEERRERRIEQKKSIV